MWLNTTVKEVINSTKDFIEKMKVGRMRNHFKKSSEDGKTNVSF